MSTTAEIMKKTTRAQFNIPDNVSDAEVAPAAIVNCTTGKLGEKIDQLPNVRFPYDKAQSSVKKFKSVDSSGAKQQAQMFENLLGPSSKIDQMETEKDNLKKEYAASKTELISDLHKVYDPNSNASPQETVARIEKEQKRLSVETERQSQTRSLEKKRIEAIDLQMASTLPSLATGGPQVSATPGPQDS